MPGSTSPAACFTPTNNLFISSDTTDRLTAYNGGGQSYSLLQEGGELDVPRGIAFLNSTTLLLANFQGQNVLLVTVEGEVVDVFATNSGPQDVILLDNTDTVAVSSMAFGGGIHFFSVDDYEQRGTLDFQESGDTDFVEMPTGAGGPRSMCEGEGEGEILVTTYNNRVIRVCAPNTTCRASHRTATMLYGQNLEGIVKLEDTYLVADRKTVGYAAGIVYQCPICTFSEAKCPPRRRKMTPPPSPSNPNLLAHPNPRQLPRTSRRGAAPSSRRTPRELVVLTLSP
jgi:hypothetical protein